VREPNSAWIDSRIFCPDRQLYAEYGRTSGGVITRSPNQEPIISTVPLTGFSATKAWTRIAFLQPRGHHSIEINSAGRLEVPSRRQDLYLWRFRSDPSGQGFEQHTTDRAVAGGRGWAKRAADGCDCETDPHFRRAGQTPPRIQTDDTYRHSSPAVSCVHPLPNVPNSVSGDTGCSSLHLYSSIPRTTQRLGSIISSR